MEPLLRELLRDTSDADSNENPAQFTHVTLYGPRARWSIRPHNLTPFWVGYCRLVRDYPQTNLCLAERPQDVMPVIIESTFRFIGDPNESWEPFDDDFLHSFISCVQEVILEHFEISLGHMELACCVLEPEQMWQEQVEGNEYSSRGEESHCVTKLRLQFPYCRVDASLQSRLLRPKLIQLLHTKNIMRKLTRQPLGDWDQIISSTTMNEPVVMYGSSEAPDRPKLILNRIFGSITQETLEDGSEIKSAELEDAFIPTNHTDVQRNVVNADIFADEEKDHWLPLFLSLGYWPSIVLPKEKEQANRAPLRPTPSFGQTENNKYIYGTDASERDEIPLETADRMLQIISTTRYRNEAFWSDIGRALSTITDGDDSGMRTWMRYTQRAIGDDELPLFMSTFGSIEEACRSAYYSFPSHYVTVKTLAWFAMEDSPERYKEWHRDWLMKTMEKASSCLHTDVAIALNRCYWLDYACAQPGKNVWYNYKNHRWTAIDQGVDLKRLMSSEFLRRFENQRTYLSRQIQESNDEGFRTNAELTMKKLSNLIAKLKTVSFKSNLLREAQEHFHHQKFCSLLDANPELIGVKNGVLEVTGSRIVFRSGKPEDYISMCTGIPFREELHLDHPLVKECMDWISKVFTDPSLKHHFMKFSSSILKGRNSDKIFPIWTGEGDNSKSMIVMLFESCFGPYCIKFPVSLLTGKRASSGSANPELARSKSTRIVFLQEPDDEEPMRKGIIKEFTGNDSFFARALFDGGGEVQATFKMVLQCNKVPCIPSSDRAIKNRTKIFPFMSTWVDDAPPTLEEQYKQRRFQKNPHFAKRIPILAPSFLWLLSYYFPFYINEGLVDPPIISEATEEYWNEHDFYNQFVSECIQQAPTRDDNKPDTNFKLSLAEVYNEFKDWYKDAFPNVKVPERSVVRSELSNRMGRLSGNNWHAVRFIEKAATVDHSYQLGGRKREGPHPVIPVEAARIRV